MRYIVNLCHEQKYGHLCGAHFVISPRASKRFNHVVEDKRFGGHRGVCFCRKEIKLFKKKSAGTQTGYICIGIPLG